MQKNDEQIYVILSALKQRFQNMLKITDMFLHVVNQLTYPKNENFYLSGMFSQNCESVNSALMKDSIFIKKLEGICLSSFSNCSNSLETDIDEEKRNRMSEIYGVNLGYYSSYFIFIDDSLNYLTDIELLKSKFKFEEFENIVDILRQLFHVYLQNTSINNLDLIGFILIDILDQEQRLEYNKPLYQLIYTYPNFQTLESNFFSLKNFFDRTTYIKIDNNSKSIFFSIMITKTRQLVMSFNINKLVSQFFFDEENDWNIILEDNFYLNFNTTSRSVDFTSSTPLYIGDNNQTYFIQSEYEFNNVTLTINFNLLSSYYTVMTFQRSVSRWALFSIPIIIFGLMYIDFLRQIQYMLMANINKLTQDLSDYIHFELPFNISRYIFQYNCENKEFIERVNKLIKENEQMKENYQKNLKSEELFEEKKQIYYWKFEEDVDRLLK